MRFKMLITMMFFVSAVFAYASGPLDGFWKIDIDSKRPNSELPSQKKIVHIRQDGNALVIRDVIKGIETKGYLRRNQIGLDVKLLMGKEERPYSLTGNIVDKNISGKIAKDGVEATWAAYKLASLWGCSNHRPIHVASSKEEMEELSKEYNCDGWHALQQ